MTSSSENAATVSCPTGATTLVRTELYMAGWHADVNGKPVTITKSDGAYQSIPVPAGTSKVEFSFMPPHEKYAILAGLLAALFLAFTWIRERIPARRLRRER